MRKLAGVVAGFLMAGVVAAPAMAKGDGASNDAASIEVRGGWSNEAGCVPVNLGPTSDPNAFDIECTGGSAWDGDFTGHTIVHLTGTIDTGGHMSGAYEELFIGTYAGDNSYGGLHTKGTFSATTATFHAEAKIIGGSCAWEGSSGWMTYDGASLNGGYDGRWNRPVTAPPADPTCIPADRLPE